MSDFEELRDTSPDGELTEDDRQEVSEQLKLCANSRARVGADIPMPTVRTVRVLGSSSG